MKDKLFSTRNGGWAAFILKDNKLKAILAADTKTTAQHYYNGMKRVDYPGESVHIGEIKLIIHKTARKKKNER